ncbi:MAG TPA: dTDP-4-dehydrorhamnose reductase [Methylomirabilota bacterium]|jgi:dTDP-4-dehydrorhamnose reductase|nr:dTDP-4-dehydrorhamnose reductase [Methylomirabilota bacterium]
MKRLLVTGAAGMVGAYVADVFHDWQVVLTDIVGDVERLDVRDPDDVRRAVARTAPDAVLHLAAETDVDACEREPDRAHLTNALGTRYVAAACQAADVPLVYVSTAGVFSGDKSEPYVESDVPRPLNRYATAKLAGEIAVTALVARHIIVRAGWMIGGGVRDKKFVGKVTELIATGRSPLRAVNDAWGSPTHAKDLLVTVARLVDAGHGGLYHVANAGSATRYDVALVVRAALRKEDVEVVPVASTDFPQTAPRPRSEAVRCRALEALGMPLRPWREAVTEYVTQELAPRFPPV